MDDHERLRELMRRWQAGWVTVRDHRAVTGDDTVAVRVGLPDRVAETIVLTARPERYAVAAAQTAGPGHWLTAPTTDRQRTEAAAAAAGFTVHPPEWLMSRPLAGHPGDTPPDGYRLLLSGRPPVLVAEVVADGAPVGGLAALARLGLSGPDAVADRVFTVPEHRRRGLGRVVMGAVAAAARENGARTGLLIASRAGRALYERLGWRVEAEIVAAHWSGHAPPEPAADPLE